MPRAKPPEIRSLDDYARWFASLGGKARKKAMTPEERRANAELAASQRWRGSTREERRAAAQKAARARWAKKGRA